MQFILGALSTAGFFGLLSLAFMAGKRSKTQPKLAAAEKQKEVNEQAKRRSDAMRKGFDELMAYDVKTALHGEKVT